MARNDSPQQTQFVGGQSANQFRWPHDWQFVTKPLRFRAALADTASTPLSGMNEIDSSIHSTQRKTPRIVAALAHRVAAHGVSTHSLDYRRARNADTFAAAAEMGKVVEPVR
jgi:hypothetical protein